VSIEEWGNCIHDSVPSFSLLEALIAADAMIQEMLDLGILTRISRHRKRVSMSPWITRRTSAPSTAPVTCWIAYRSR
jgi:hypothetical protein